VVFRWKSCPKCKGDVWLDQDDYGWYEQCTICDYLCSLDGIKYIDGMESAIVTRQDNTRIYPLHPLLETLKSTMKAKVQEARVYILTELSKGELEKRQLRLRMRGEGIIKYAFETALKELKDSGMVVANKAKRKGNRAKLALAT